MENNTLDEKLVVEIYKLTAEIMDLFTPGFLRMLSPKAEIFHRYAAQETIDVNEIFSTEGERETFLSDIDKAQSTYDYCIEHNVSQEHWCKELDEFQPDLSELGSMLGEMIFHMIQSNGYLEFNKCTELYFDGVVEMMMKQDVNKYIGGRAAHIADCLERKYGTVFFGEAKIATLQTKTMFAEKIDYFNAKILQVHTMMMETLEYF